MRTRAGEMRAWRSAMAGRARIWASARAEALPERPAAERESTAATAVRRAQPRLYLARLVSSPANRLALIVLAAAALYRLILILRGWPALDSDEAIIGLMARHILHGQFDYWFWGQQYMGAFQAYVVAGVFAVIGSSAFSLHLTMLLFTLVFLAAMYFLGRAAYGPAVGILTLAWLAVGPPVGVLRELTAIGGYQDMLVFGSLILLGVWSRLRQPAPLPRSRKEWSRALLVYTGIGLAGGIGLWSDLLFLPVLFMAAYTLPAVRTREIFHYCGLVLVLAFLVGGFPYISYNITNKNATYKEVVRQTHSGNTQAATLPAAGDWLNQTGEAFSVAVPVILASPHVCANQGIVWPAYPPAEAEVNYAPPGACDGANIAFSLAAIFIYLTVAWQIALVFRRWLVNPLARLRSWTHTSRRPAHSRRKSRRSRATQSTFTISAEETGRLWLRLMLLGIAAMTLALYTTNQDAQRYQFTSSRYLLPLYLTTPLLFGGLWQFARPRLQPLLAAALGHVSTTVPRLALYGPWRGSTSSSLRGGWGAKSILSSLALFALLASSIGGGILTLAYAFDGQRFALPEPPLDQHLIAYLDAHHITAFYSDYWTCYRTMFETNERLTCAVRGQNGEIGLELINNRNDAYVQALARVPYPTYILPAGTDEDRYFVNEAVIEGLPHTGYRRVILDGYAIYYHPS